MTAVSPATPLNGEVESGTDKGAARERGLLPKLPDRDKSMQKKREKKKVSLILLLSLLLVERGGGGRGGGSLTKGWMQQPEKADEEKHRKQEVTGFFLRFVPNDVLCLWHSFMVSTDQSLHSAHLLVKLQSTSLH